MDTIRFDELQLDDKILKAVKEMGFEAASPIQAKAIPAVLEGNDIVGQAQTGTGKTAAFGIPLLQKLDTKNKKPQAIVLCPTRELAIQSSDELRKLAKFMHGAKVLPIYGGQNITNQIRSLKAGVNVIVGTPGRIMDHLRRHTIKLDDLHTVVLDEADEMLNMGFREDIETILKELPKERQTLLFSATMPKAILDITKKYQTNSKHIKVTKKELTVPNIEQYYYEVRPKQKVEVLCRLLDMYAPKLSVVFCNTKRMVDDVATQLKNRGYFAEGLHGDLKQSQRDRVMKSFRNGRVDILVATDVAARGIDVDDVDAVFNYDLPQDDEFYVHRIGRTGRAGREGNAFSFVSGKETYKLRDIQRYCKTKIKARPIPSLNDVQATRAENTLDDVAKAIEDNSLEKYVEIIDDFINETDYTALEIAAAFLKMKFSENEEISKNEEDFGDTGAEAGMVRLFINIGKKKGVRPGDILGAIAGESSISGDLVGAIDMHDQYTFVEVPQEVAKDVLYGMRHAKIKGKSVSMEPANRK
ncbi:MAG: DEAD/DEAH box helicase [Anaerostipes sp.]|nr:DEAD/DEAH box helicase [Anaerostipes sp.]